MLILLLQNNKKVNKFIKTLYFIFINCLPNTHTSTSVPEDSQSESPEGVTNCHAYNYWSTAVLCHG